MTLRKKWNAFWSPNVALAFDRYGLWRVSEPESDPSRSAASVAVHNKSRKVVAIGDAALDLRDGASQDVTVADYTARGTIVDFDLAEIAFRQELRAWAGSKLRLAPRVLVASSSGEVEKRVIKDVVANSGARDIITIPRLMAAAIGSGLDVDQCRAQPLIYLDRDWAEISIIGRASVLAKWEGADAIDQALVEYAWMTRGTGDEKARDFDVMYTHFMRHGVTDNSAASALILRLRERFLGLLDSLPNTEANVTRDTAVYLVGPCAHVPGLREMLASCWKQPVFVPDKAKSSVILGCRKLLPELDWIVKNAV